MNALPILSQDAGLSAYMAEIKKFPMLSEAEEFELARKMHEENDVGAAHTLVTSYLRLVVKLANGFRGYGLPMVEVISEGNIGLMQAVKRFDPSKGFRLSTYAMWWIKAAMQEYVLHSWSLVKIGTTAAQKKLFFSLRKVKNRICSIHNNGLSPDEVGQIADELQVSQQEVVDMNSRLTYNDTSLNQTVANDEEGTTEHIDMLASQEESHDIIIAENNELAYRRNLLKNAMESLSERDQDIFTARRLLEKPLTLDDLSKKYDISRERVRQIEAKSMEKLQKIISAVA